MKQSAKKRPGYLTQVMKEIDELIDACDSKNEAKDKLTAYMTDRILESYKNGIAAGKKQAGDE